MNSKGPKLKPFVDWYEIWPGQAGRRDNGDTWLQDPPEGVHLTIQEARLSEPIVRAEKPWETASIVYPCVIHEEGRYRMWHWSQGDVGGRYNSYQESDDGWNWKRPELGLCEYQGSVANNLLSSHDEAEIDCVFVDPTAGPDERYKAICPKTIFFRVGVLDPEMDWPKFRELGRQTGAATDPTRNTMTAVREEFNVWRDNALFGAVSADGLRWRVLEEPLVNVGGTPLDSQNVAAYNPDTGEYVAYMRGFPEEPEYGVRGRRALRRSGGKEFGNWHAPQYVLSADAQDPPTDDIYTPAYCAYPGVPGLYLMFPSIYHRLDSELDVQLAVSRDGWSWVRPERRPIISRVSGDREYGMDPCRPQPGVAQRGRLGGCVRWSLQPSRSRNTRVAGGVPLGDLAAQPTGCSGRAGGGTCDDHRQAVPWESAAHQFPHKESGLGKGRAGYAAHFTNQRDQDPGRVRRRECGCVDRRRAGSGGDLEREERSVLSAGPDDLGAPAHGARGGLLAGVLKPTRQ